MLANQNRPSTRVFGDPPKINQSEDSVIDVLDKFRLDPDCTIVRVVKIVFIISEIVIDWIWSKLNIALMNAETLRLFP